MTSIQQRIKRIEANVGIVDKDITLDFGNGESITMKESEFKRILAKIDGKTRGLPRDERRSTQVETIR